jgi:hypothetical protein
LWLSFYPRFCPPFRFILVYSLFLFSMVYYFISLIFFLVFLSSLCLISVHFFSFHSLSPYLSFIISQFLLPPLYFPSSFLPHSLPFVSYSFLSRLHDFLTFRPC